MTAKLRAVSGWTPTVNSISEHHPDYFYECETDIMRGLSKFHQEKELLMELVFLGTGSAWGLPEYSCACVTCKEMLKQGESRTRTSFVITGLETILVDCGPDLRFQMWNCGLQRPDFVLITHEHGDHYLGTG